MSKDPHIVSTTNSMFIDTVRESGFYSILSWIDDPSLSIWMEFTSNCSNLPVWCDTPEDLFFITSDCEVLCWDVDQLLTFYKYQDSLSPL